MRGIGVVAKGRGGTPFFTAAVFGPRVRMPLYLTEINALSGLFSAARGLKFHGGFISQSRNSMYLKTAKERGDRSRE